MANSKVVSPDGLPIGEYIKRVHDKHPFPEIDPLRGLVSLKPGDFVGMPSPNALREVLGLHSIVGVDLAVQHPASLEVVPFSNNILFEEYYDHLVLKVSDRAEASAWRCGQWTARSCRSESCRLIRSIRI